MISDSIMIDLGKTSFLRADAAGEIAEMIDRERQVGGLRFANRLAIVDRLDEGQEIELLFDAVGDAQKRERAFGGGGSSPGFPRRMRGV